MPTIALDLQDFLVQEEFYIQEWTGYRTNPECKKSYEELLKEFKSKITPPSIQITEPKWQTPIKQKKTSSR